MYKCQVIRLKIFQIFWSYFKEFIPNKYFSYFREATSSDSKFVLITSTPGKGCVSSLGFAEMIQTDLNLDEECFSPSTIMHELFHTLGVSHYHQRSDRDKYVIIHWDNIRPDMHFAYCKDRSGAGDGEKSTYGTDYDFKSFMHYHDSFNALDMNKPTISSKVKFIS